MGQSGKEFMSFGIVHSGLSAPRCAVSPAPSHEHPQRAFLFHCVEKCQALRVNRLFAGPFPACVEAGDAAVFKELMHEARYLFKKQLCLKIRQQRVARSAHHTAAHRANARMHDAPLVYLAHRLFKLEKKSEPGLTKTRPGTGRI